MKPSSTDQNAKNPNSPNWGPMPLATLLKAPAKKVEKEGCVYHIIPYRKPVVIYIY